MPSDQLFLDYLQGLKNLPELIRRFPWKRRSLDEELVQATLRGSLRRAFSGWELLLFGCGIVIGSGLYNQRGTVAWELAGPSVVVAYALGGISALCAAAIYGEFVLEFPVSGGGYTFVMHSFGELLAWLTGSNLVLCYTVTMSGVAKNFTYNLQRLTNFSATFIIELGSEGGWSLDFFAFGLVVLATLILCAGSREYGFLVSGATLLKLALLVVIIVACFTKADADNLQPFTKPAVQGNPGGATGIFQALALSYHAYVGYDALTNAAEEARDPADLPPAMLGVVVVSVLIYVPLALSLVMMAPTNGIYQCCQPPGSDTCNISLIFLDNCPDGVDMPWVPYLISVGGLMAGIAGILVGLFSLARLVMVISRDWLLPPMFANVYPRTQTPVLAQCTAGTIVAILALLVPLEDLSILTDFTALFAIWMVCNAHLFRRYYPDIRLRYTKHGTVEEAPGTRKYMAWAPGGRLPPILLKGLVWTHIFLISGISIALAVYWQVLRNIETVGFIGGLALATLSFQLTCPLEYQPATTWAVPWWAMPWVPCTCIALTIFSLASLDPSHYWVVGVWFGVSFGFYLLFSLPMSYIKHRKLDYVNTEQLSVVEVAFKDGKWVTVSSATGSSLPDRISSLDPGLRSPASLRSFSLGGPSTPMITSLLASYVVSTPLSSRSSRFGGEQDRRQSGIFPQLPRSSSGVSAQAGGLNPATFSQ